MSENSNDIITEEVSLVLSTGNNLKRLATVLFHSKLASDIRKTFHYYARIIHPDKCADKRAPDAFRILFECYHYVLENPHVISGGSQSTLKTKVCDVMHNAQEKGQSLVEILREFEKYEQEFMKDNAFHVQKYELLKKRKRNSEYKIDNEASEMYFETLVGDLDNRASRWQNFKPK